jgi:hypothetical protein
MPSTGITVSSGDRQSDREGLSWKDQPRVEQRRPLGRDDRGGSVCLSISVHPFYCIVDSDCDGYVDRIWVRACREFCLELR